MGGAFQVCGLQDQSNCRAGTYGDEVGRSGAGRFYQILRAVVCTHCTNSSKSSRGRGLEA